MSKRTHCGKVVTDIEAYADACVAEITICRALLVTLFEITKEYMPDNLKEQWNEFIETDADEAANNLIVMYDKACK